MSCNTMYKSELNRFLFNPCLISESSLLSMYHLQIKETAKPITIKWLVVCQKIKNANFPSAVSQCSYFHTLQLSV